MQVFCDFDGTISVRDVTDVILTHFADKAWLAIEDEWKAGRIGSAECMQRQIPLIRANKAELDAALDAVEIDPGFPAFVRLCQSEGIPVTIISDGVDYFIERILARHHLPALPIIANHLEILTQDGHTTYTLTSPFSRNDCASAAGVCKCRSVGAVSGDRIYVGDGQSDFCVANKPELVFAKGKLAAFCETNAIDYAAYSLFSDVTHALRTHVLPDRSPVPAAAHAPSYAFA